MKLLAVDTCSGGGSLALARDDGWCEMLSLTGEWKSATLHSEMASLLDAQHLRTRDLDGYAVTNGPGTFTGLRIGLTAMKALAEVHRKPIVTISTLEVLAASARDTLPTSFSGGLAAILDARRGQIFGALFRTRGLVLKPVIADCVCSLKKFLESVRGAGYGELRFCATDLAPYAGEIRGAGWDESTHLSVSRSLAGTLARMGLTRLQQGQGRDAAAAEANYVRPSDAEIFWKG
jgi:tRNA threonylcarbamoyladenosine biosynthesis protein TsaB